MKCELDHIAAGDGKISRVSIGKSKIPFGSVESGFDHRSLSKSHVAERGSKRTRKDEFESLLPGIDEKGLGLVARAAKERQCADTHRSSPSLGRARRRNLDLLQRS